MSFPSLQYNGALVHSARETHSHPHSHRTHTKYILYRAAHPAPGRRYKCPASIGIDISTPKKELFKLAVQRCLVHRARETRSHPQGHRTHACHPTDTIQLTRNALRARVMDHYPFSNFTPFQNTPQMTQNRPSNAQVKRNQRSTYHTSTHTCARHGARSYIYAIRQRTPRTKKREPVTSLQMSS